MINAEFVLPPEDVWMRRGGPANEAEINQLLEKYPDGLPAPYVELLRNVNGGACELGIWPWWLELWPLEKVLSANAERKVGEFPKGFFAFGKGDEGVVFAFRLNDPGRSTVYGFSSGSPASEDVRVVAEDFITFAQAMGRFKPWDPGPVSSLSPPAYAVLGLFVYGAFLLFGFVLLYLRVLSYDQYYSGNCGGITGASNPCSLAEYRSFRLLLLSAGFIQLLWPILLAGLFMTPFVFWRIGKRKQRRTDS
jgi:hypothetical protein